MAFSMKLLKHKLLCSIMRSVVKVIAVGVSDAAPTERPGDISSGRMALSLIVQSRNGVWAQYHKTFFCKKNITLALHFRQRLGGAICSPLG